MADMMTLQEHFGDLKNVHLAYVGDGNNVAHSLLLAAASLGAFDFGRNAEGLRAESRDCFAAREELADAHRVKIVVTNDRG